MNQPIVYVLAHCVCTGPLCMYQPIVYVLAHCVCTCPLCMYLPIVYVLAHCVCTSPLCMYQLIVYVQKPGQYNKGEQSRLSCSTFTVPWDHGHRYIFLVKDNVVCCSKSFQRNVTKFNQCFTYVPLNLIFRKFCYRKNLIFEKIADKADLAQLQTSSSL